MNVAKTGVVIDKSFLHGASKDILQSLFQNHRILMPFVHFHELLTTSISNRGKCFNRLPKGENPLALVESVDLIRRWELENRQPLLNINHVIIQGSSNFNPELVNENFQMGEEQTRYTEDLNEQVAIRAQKFAEHSSKTSIRFPELRNYRPGNDPSQIEEIQKRICTDQEFAVNSITVDGRENGLQQNTLMSNGHYLDGYKSGS